MIEGIKTTSGSAHCVPHMTYDSGDMIQQNRLQQKQIA
jgi:hypothetical protein